ncbi:hypothetical protein TWF970_011388 [Orbilia oligospora]|uniref:Uncharacterized protein n=1 Tax=Orbilia oligospora TaxID=2813651 RepID=A0A7C8RH09_ORBOL|nr:hypothetical protein TWF970_011388 [Orbilia oligospora]
MERSPSLEALFSPPLLDTTDTFTTPTTTTTKITPPTYTATEVSYMIRVFQSEANFLTQHGFNISNPTERAVGPTLLKVLMGAPNAAENLAEVARVLGGNSFSLDDLNAEEEELLDIDPNLMNDMEIEIEPLDMTDQTIIPKSGAYNPRHRAIQYRLLPFEDDFKTNWIFSPTTHVHSTNNASWFKTFFSFNAMTNQGDTVTGGGSIDLPIITNRGVAIVTLQNVIYTPLAICNVFGGGGGEDIGLFGFEPPTSFEGSNNNNNGGCGKMFMNRNRSVWSWLEGIGNPYDDDKEGERSWMRLKIVGQQNGRGRVGIPSENSRYSLSKPVVNRVGKIMELKWTEDMFRTMKNGGVFRIEGELANADLLRFDMALVEDEYRRCKDGLEAIGVDVDGI